MEEGALLVAGENLGSGCHCLESIAAADRRDTQVQSFEARMTAIAYKRLGCLVSRQDFNKPRPLIVFAEVRT